MPSTRHRPSDEAEPKISAYALQRAAGQLQAHASTAGAVDDLEVTLAHVEEALDRLAVGLLKMADAVADRCAEPGELPPEGRALRFHLQMAATALRAPQDGCASSRMWTRRLLDGSPVTT
jgi:hypothetical protein